MNTISALWSLIGYWSEYNLSFSLDFKVNQIHSCFYYAVYIDFGINF